ncbi:hypothetical protein IWZ00DRAFT_489957 [Phyllosticta capitalensis]|uniref:Uncharacterized protein n=1 Tax=Phyllosticta capitalensis TaxID=121624 RepID=A0ABR1YK42_9PEZI
MDSPRKVLAPLVEHHGFQHHSPNPPESRVGLDSKLDENRARLNQDNSSHHLLSIMASGIAPANTPKSRTTIPSDAATVISGLDGKLDEIRITPLPSLWIPCPSQLLMG